VNFRSGCVPGAYRGELAEHGRGEPLGCQRVGVRDLVDGFGEPGQFRAAPFAVGAQGAAVPVPQHHRLPCGVAGGASQVIAWHTPLTHEAWPSSQSAELMQLAPMLSNGTILWVSATWFGCGGVPVGLVGKLA